MALKQIPISELHIGMYVAKLDLSWFRSPFLRHSFLVEHTWQIERLVKTGVRSIMIDPDRSLAAVETFDTHHGRFMDILTTSPTGDSSAPHRAVKSLAQLHEEYTQAKRVQEKLDHAVQAVFSVITNTGTIRREQAAEAVQEITIAARTLSPSALFIALTHDRAGDPLLSRHALSTCTVALVLGQSFQFNPLELQELATAALLHDIGLSQIPAEVLQQVRVTSSPLPHTEHQRFGTHPQLSVQALERQGTFEPAVLQLIANHHPPLPHYGLARPPAASSLSLAASILRTADHFDELITGFGGASSLTTQQALQRMYLGTQQQQGLDSTILARFISIVGIYPVHSYVQLNTKERAVVTTLNAEKLHQPVITITHSSDGAEYHPPVVVDLAHQNDSAPLRTIESVLDRQPGHQAADSSRAA